MRRAALVLHFGAQRGGDCTELRWTDYDGIGLQVAPQKTTDGHHDEAGYLKCPQVLRDALDAASRVGEFILVNKFERKWATRRR